MATRVLVIDNYDSFVYNLVQYLGELGAEPLVYRNDELALDQIIALDPSAVLISPGPGTPDDAGVSNDVIRSLRRQGAGARRLPRASVHRPGVRRADRAGPAGHARQDVADPPHGQRACSPGCPIRSRPPATTAWSSTGPRCPSVLEITAETDDGIVMGLRHRELGVEGVQFHPESVLTVGGHDLLRNFLAGALIDR